MSGVLGGNNGPLGLDPERSVLYAQVMDAEPQMSFDEGGVLIQKGTKGEIGKVFLGDVAKATLRAIGTHDPPRFTQEPVYDEQRWELECLSDELQVRIGSRHYWGFGLLARCFLNEIVIEGPLSSRSRCVLDLVASLGRNPWEPTRVRAFEKATSARMGAHRSSWEGLVSLAKEGFSEEITLLQDSLHRLRGVGDDSDELLDSAQEALDRAMEALSDKNAPAVERALSRASSAIIQSDPNTEVSSADLDEL